MLRGSGLGFILGLVPGGGPVTASFMSYALEKRISKTPERFGEGAIEGVAGRNPPTTPRSPAVSFRFSRSAFRAIRSPRCCSARWSFRHSARPLFVTQRPDLFWGIVASMYIGNVFLLLLNLPLVGLWAQLLRIPYRVLFPVVLLLSVVGTYSANKNVFDLWVMLGFGVAGYVLRKLEYDLAPFVIAFVLAPMLEQSMRQSLAMSPDGAMIFFNGRVPRCCSRPARCSSL